MCTRGLGIYNGSVVEEYTHAVRQLPQLMRQFMLRRFLKSAYKRDTRRCILAPTETASKNASLQIMAVVEKEKNKNKVLWFVAIYKEAECFLFSFCRR